MDTSECGTGSEEEQAVQTSVSMSSSDPFEEEEEENETQNHALTDKQVKSQDSSPKDVVTPLASANQKSCDTSSKDDTENDLKAKEVNSDQELIMSKSSKTKVPGKKSKLMEEEAKVEDRDTTREILVRKDGRSVSVRQLELPRVAVSLKRLQIEQVSAGKSLGSSRDSAPLSKAGEMEAKADLSAKKGNLPARKPGPKSSRSDDETNKKPGKKSPPVGEVTVKSGDSSQDSGSSTPLLRRSRNHLEGTGLSKLQAEKNPKSKKEQADPQLKKLDSKISKPSLSESQLDGEKSVKSRDSSQESGTSTPVLRSTRLHHEESVTAGHPGQTDPKMSKKEAADLQLKKNDLKPSKTPVKKIQTDNEKSMKSRDSSRESRSTTPAHQKPENHDEKLVMAKKKAGLDLKCRSEEAEIQLKKCELKIARVSVDKNHSQGDKGLRSRDSSLNGTGSAKTQEGSKMSVNKDAKNSKESMDNDSPPKENDANQSRKTNNLSKTDVSVSGNKSRGSIKTSKSSQESGSSMPAQDQKKSGQRNQAQDSETSNADKNVEQKLKTSDRKVSENGLKSRVSVKSKESSGESGSSSPMLPASDGKNSGQRNQVQDSKTLTDDKEMNTKGLKAPVKKIGHPLNKSVPKEQSPKNDVSLKSRGSLQDSAPPSLEGRNSRQRNQVQESETLNEDKEKSSKNGMRTQQRTGSQSSKSELKVSDNKSLPKGDVPDKSQDVSLDSLKAIPTPAKPIAAKSTSPKAGDSMTQKNEAKKDFKSGVSASPANGDKPAQSRVPSQDPTLTLEERMALLHNESLNQGGTKSGLKSNEKPSKKGEITTPKDSVKKDQSINGQDSPQDVMKTVSVRLIRLEVDPLAKDYWPLGKDLSMEVSKTEETVISMSRKRGRTSEPSSVDSTSKKPKMSKTSRQQEDQSDSMKRHSSHDKGLSAKMKSSNNSTLGEKATLFSDGEGIVNKRQKIAEDGALKSGKSKEKTDSPKPLNYAKGKREGLALPGKGPKSRIKRPSLKDTSSEIGSSRSTHGSSSRASSGIHNGDGKSGKSWSIAGDGSTPSGDTERDLDLSRSPDRVRRKSSVKAMDKMKEWASSDMRACHVEIATDKRKVGLLMAASLSSPPLLSEDTENGEAAELKEMDEVLEGFQVNLDEVVLTDDDNGEEATKASKVGEPSKAGKKKDNPEDIRKGSGGKRKNVVVSPIKKPPEKKDSTIPPNSNASKNEIAPGATDTLEEEEYFSAALSSPGRADDESEHEAHENVEDKNAKEERSSSKKYGANDENDDDGGGGTLTITPTNISSASKKKRKFGAAKNAGKKVRPTLNLVDKINADHNSPSAEVETITLGGAGGPATLAEVGRQFLPTKVDLRKAKKKKKKIRMVSTGGDVAKTSSLDRQKSLSDRRLAVMSAKSRDHQLEEEVEEIASDGGLSITM